MFTNEDYRRLPHYGHSRPADAIEICREAGVKQLALFHHAPERSDAEVDAILADARALVERDKVPLDVVAAYEGMDLSLGNG
jgi:ribonuclease BN (tRNA processing enzyme)